MLGYQFDARFVIPSADFLNTPFVLAGADEAGRGPLAGPVVAAAVVLPESPKIYGLRDSKVVPLEQREALFCEIQEVALAFAVIDIGPDVIDEINILQASLKAMREAVLALNVKPHIVLIDGNQKLNSGFNEQPIIGGDALSASIMAASILAKVTRDHFMRDEHEKYPQYGFNDHKGYGAPVHLAALEKYGPCPHSSEKFCTGHSTFGPLQQEGHMSEHNKHFGRGGEELAKSYLERKGYTWVASNFSTRWGEVDLIMKYKATYVFIEVKRRMDEQFGAPEEAVTRTKRNHMIKGALMFLQEAGLQDQMVRFDVVSIGPQGTKHVPNAFYAGGEYYY